MLKQPGDPQQVFSGARHVHSSSTPEASGTLSWQIRQAKADVCLSMLNFEQTAAATSEHHAVQVKAGPGTGLWEPQ